VPVRYRARDAPVAVIKRVDRYKPQMGKRRPQNGIGLLIGAVCKVLGRNKGLEPRI
jgi:hypothetical protein